MLLDNGIEMLVAKVPLLAIQAEASGDYYAVAPTPFGSEKGAEYLPGARFKVDIVFDAVVVVLDEDRDRILLDRDDLAYFDCHQEYRSCLMEASLALMQEVIEDLHRPKPILQTHIYSQEPCELEFKIELLDTGVWRQIAISSHATFWDLHMAIQGAMGWRNAHLHCFEVGIPGGRRIRGDKRVNLQIGIPENVEDCDYLPGWLIPIRYYFLQEGTACAYNYDFGDNWRHLVTLAKVDRQQSRSTPVCLDGANACPVEDSGGISGYDRVRAAFCTRNKTELTAFIQELANTDHHSSLIQMTRKELNCIKRWVADCGYTDYRPESFDLDRVVFDESQAALSEMLLETGFTFDRS